MFPLKGTFKSFVRLKQQVFSFPTKQPPQAIEEDDEDLDEDDDIIVHRAKKRLRQSSPASLVLGEHLDVASGLDSAMDCSIEQRNDSESPLVSHEFAEDDEEEIADCDEDWGFTAEDTQDLSAAEAEAAFAQITAQLSDMQLDEDDESDYDSDSEDDEASASFSEEEQKLVNAYELMDPAARQQQHRGEPLSIVVHPTTYCRMEALYDRFMVYLCLQYTVWRLSIWGESLRRPDLLDIIGRSLTPAFREILNQKHFTIDDLEALPVFVPGKISGTCVYFRIDVYPHKKEGYVGKTNNAGQRFSSHNSKFRHDKTKDPDRDRSYRLLAVLDPKDKHLAKIVESFLIVALFGMKANGKQLKGYPIDLRPTPSHGVLSTATELPPAMRTLNAQLPLTEWLDNRRRIERADECIIDGCTLMRKEDSPYCFSCFRWVYTKRLIPSIADLAARDERRNQRIANAKFHCPICPGRFYKHNHDLLEHNRKKHPELARPKRGVAERENGAEEWHCPSPTCDKTFLSESGLMKHVKIKDHRDPNKPRFVPIEELDPASLFYCASEGCGKRFRSSDSRINHYRAFHQKEGLAPERQKKRKQDVEEEDLVQCDECSDTFVTRAGLRQHKRRDHEAKPARRVHDMPVEERWYCNHGTCKSFFAEHKDLVKHRTRIHHLKADRSRNPVRCGPKE